MRRCFIPLTLSGPEVGRWAESARADFNLRGLPCNIFDIFSFIFNNDFFKTIANSLSPSQEIDNFSQLIGFARSVTS